MLIAIYHILKDGTAFNDLGSKYYDSFNKERKANSLKKVLERLGYNVTLKETETPAATEAPAV